jgi:hypothetical protein
MIDSSQVSDSERISRYLVEKSKFSAVNRRVKPNAFVPPPSGKLSVYRTEGQEESEIWNLGVEHVGRVLGKPILARADLKASDFSQRNLRFEPDGVPHPRHCNIINWPAESQWLSTAQDLASAAQLHLRPESESW